MAQTVEAYTTLSAMLCQKRMSVRALFRAIEERGLKVNLQSLYGLKREQDIERLDMQVAAAICLTLNVALSDLIQIRPLMVRLRRLAPNRQRRLEELMELHSQTEPPVEELETQGSCRRGGSRVAGQCAVAGERNGLCFRASVKIVCRFASAKEGRKKGRESLRVLSCASGHCRLFLPRRAHTCGDSRPHRRCPILEVHLREVQDFRVEMLPVLLRGG